MPREVHRLTAENRADFFRLHNDEHDAGWCFCVAWWVRIWEGWGERSAEQNRTLREALFERCDQYDGYLLYVDDEPVGWCQAGPRDRLEKLARQFNLEPDPDTWALTCFLIAPQVRGQGMAASLLAGVLDDLRARGVKRVEAFPKRGEGLDAGDLWNGPEAMFRAAGFAVVRDDPARPVLALRLL
jgi:GNAT superfamily N-acetyltransferase